MYLTKLGKYKRKLSHEEQQEIRLLRKQQNFNTCRQISYVSFMIGLLSLVIYYIVFRSLWIETPAYRYLFYIHLSYVVCLVIYYCFLVLLKNIKSRKNLVKTIICYYFIIVTFLFCIFMSIVAELIHNHIYAYIIVIFAISYFLVFNTVQIMTLLGGSLIVFAVGSFLFNENSAQVFSYTMNSLACIVLAYFVARINYISFIKDFLNKKKLLTKNRQLKEKNKNKSILLGNTSHELKTPLNMIYSAEQMLNISVNKGVKDVELKNKLMRYLVIIKQNSFRLMRLINNIVDTTKMDIGEYKMEFQNIDIVSLINQIVQSVSSYVEEQRINLNFHSELYEKIIACDPDSIERILLNLISNAVKYTPAGGHIDVSIFPEEDYLLISVKDTGTGIAEELQESIFERYIQADDSLTKKSGGSGIGLSLVKHLVTRHEGEIELISAPGQGSEFIVKLPDRLIENKERTDENEINLINDSIIEKIKLEFSDIYKV